MDSYYKEKRAPDGLMAVCRLCHNARMRVYNKTYKPKRKHDYSKTPGYIICKMYHHAIERTKRQRSYFGRVVGFSLQEFKEFVARDDVFENLFEAWRASGWDKRFSPSLDRIDNSQGYTLDNIQLMTKSANCRKFTS